MSSTLRQRKPAPLGAPPVSENYSENPKEPSRAAVVDGFSRKDWLICGALLIVGLITRLWNIEDPRSQIFDETHFTKFATWYVTGHHYVDIHPPLAKLVFAIVLVLRGFVGAEEEFVDWWLPNKFVGTKDWLLLYEEEYGSEYIPLRKTSAIMGACLIVLGYITARAMGCRRLTSFLAAWMLGLEALILLQSRAILCDVFLYFFDLATIGASFASVRSGLSERSQIVWCVITGLMLGLCMSVKLTALGILATIGIHQALCLLVSSSGAYNFMERGLKRAAIILSVAAVIFFGLWTVHLYILPYSGQGDGFMSDPFKSTLVPKTFPHKPKCPNAEYGKRWDCGFKGITQDQCVRKGCCWDPSSPKYWCYHTSDPALNVSVDACPNRQNAWSDCGRGGISEADCKRKGCCWDPKSPQAWCYHKGVLERPTLSWWYQISDTLRATWANNNGGAVMIHPHMSEWLEWPLMLGNSVPFGSTRRGGVLKALGNPGVYWPVAAFVIGSTVGVAWYVYIVCKRVFGPIVKGAKRAKPTAVFTIATSTNELGGGGWVIPFLTLLLGYYLNLVPYQLIERSKFVYHYIPALIVGMMLTVFTCDCILRWAELTAPAAPAPVASEGEGEVVKAANTDPINVLSANRVRLAQVLVGTVFFCVAAGFYYWGLPYAYGEPLTPQQHQARKWVSKW